MQNVGQIMQPLSRRMNSHKFDISDFTVDPFSTLVASYFRYA